jgi:hypothetical protein
MADTDLALIGAILMIAVGVMTLYFIRNNKNLMWNQRLGAHIICWLFIAKGIGSAAAAFLIGAGEISGPGGTWQFTFSLLWLMDILFSTGMLALCLVFPVPILRNNKQLKIAFTAIVGFAAYRIILFMVGLGVTILELSGIIYLIAGTVWGTIYVRFRLAPEEKRNQSTENIALAAGLLLIFHMGHIWFSWPGLVMRAEYFYNLDLMEGMSHRSVEYLWQASYAFSIGLGMMMCAIEIKQLTKGRANQLSYAVIAYFVLGFIGYTILSSATDAFWWSSGKQTLAQIWITLTSSMHFTILRPLIGMYILLRFGLFDATDEMKPKAKMMVIILIVIATSALLELIQSIIPINQMFTAALLGIIVAFGIGWEERSFDKLVNAPSNMRDGVEDKWYPDVEIKESLFKGLDIGMFLFVAALLLIAYLQWQTNAIFELAVRRMNGEW